MRLKDFYYSLPENLIAQEPIKDRDQSRLLVLDRESGTIQHKVFKDVKSYLKAGDCLVLNNTRVIPARLFGKRADSNSIVEFVLLKNIGNDIWETIVKPGKKAKSGSEFVFSEGLLSGKIIDVLEDGNRLIKFEYTGRFEQVIDTIGVMPLPPYIKKKLEDKERYQTVYSKIKGSAAAPTAGLHFTNELLDEISAMGIRIVYATLHVGLGTFRPVKCEDIENHKMHSEYFKISPEACEIINEAKRAGGRVVAVGTTSCRILESVCDDAGQVKPLEGTTDIFIYPGYRFKAVDGIITNFHLPESTLIMLVSAFAGREKILNAYSKAVEEQYRFFSFGDAMLII